MISLVVAAPETLFQQEKAGGINNILHAFFSLVLCAYV